MISKHLSEIDIQQYVLDKTNCGDDIIAHMHDCERCKIKAATYQLLFAEIKQQPKPSFDFNLSALVLEQLPQAKPVPSFQKYFVLALASIVAFAIILPAYLFRIYIAYIFAGMYSSFIYALIIITVIIIIFNAVGMYKKHQKRMSLLNFN